jgi:CBS domain-containing protein
MDYVWATKIAGNVGRIVAIMMGLYGFVNGGFFLVLIAIFIFTAGAQEMRWVEKRGALLGYTVQHVYSPSIYRLDPHSNLQQAANLMLFSSQRSIPVLDGEKLIGLVPQGSLMQALKSFGPYQSVAVAINKEIEPVSLADDLSVVDQRLNEKQVDALPVVDNGRFIGLITQSQISNLIRLQAASPNSVPQSQSV